MPTTPAAKAISTRVRTRRVAAAAAIATAPGSSRASTRAKIPSRTPIPEGKTNASIEMTYDSRKPAPTSSGPPAPSPVNPRTVAHTPMLSEKQDLAHREQRLERVSAQAPEDPARQWLEHARMKEQQPERDGGHQPQPGS